MAGTIAKIKIGAAWVTFGGTDLGYTKGGIDLQIRLVTRPIVVQEVIRAMPVLRKEITVTVPLAESSYAKLQTVLGTVVVKGDDLLSLQNTLVITAVNNVNDKVTISNAFPVGETQAVFAPDRERIWPVRFMAYAYESSGITLSEAS